MVETVFLKVGGQSGGVYVLLISETVLVRAVAFLKVVRAPDISRSFVVAGSHCGSIDTGCLAVSLYGAAALHSAVTLGDS